MKCGTHAGVFSRTLVPNKTEKEGKNRSMSTWKEVQQAQKKSPDGPTVARVYRSLQGGGVGVRGNNVFQPVLDSLLFVK